MSGRPFVLHEYVRWGDVDPAGIIRWDAYTRFYELGESELFRAVGLPYRAIFRQFGIGLPRRVLHMDFVTPPVLDERLEVRVYVSDVGTTSLTMNFDVYGPGGTLRSAGYLVLVCVPAGTEEIRKRPWPPEFLALLEPYRVSVAAARAG
ncbi:MAG TPA: thioesterase family protein [Gemmatimonadaceae bacterium]|nr:thioesterase family protein [Gemmatimonadaceae bacterium]